MLAFGRRQALQPTVVAPDALLRGIAGLIASGIGPAIRLAFRLHDGWSTACDANQSENALLNLALNARDAMPAGGALTISTADRTVTAADLADQDGVEPGDYVAIIVADTGTGMEPEVLRRAFEPFFTTRPIGRGTGLGLSQMYGFVRQSGGFVRLESQPGQGTAVHCSCRARTGPDYMRGRFPRRGRTVFLAIRNRRRPCLSSRTRTASGK